MSVKVGDLVWIRAWENLAPVVGFSHDDLETLESVTSEGDATVLWDPDLCYWGTVPICFCVAWSSIISRAEEWTE